MTKTTFTAPGDDETRLGPGSCSPSAPATGWLASSGPIDHGRFPPGTVLAIVGLLFIGVVLAEARDPEVWMTPLAVSSTLCLVVGALGGDLRLRHLSRGRRPVAPAAAGSLSSFRETVELACRHCSDSLRISAHTNAGFAPEHACRARAGWYLEGPHDL